MITKWRCQGCNTSGSYEHTTKTSVWEVYNEILDQHYQANRFCAEGPQKIQVRFQK